MVYCAADTGLSQTAKSDIAFPHQVELKANLDEVKANLRGLKNKPGTTQPADVTNYIRKKPGYSNNVVMTYALTQKVSRVSPGRIPGIAPLNPHSHVHSHPVRRVSPCSNILGSEILHSRQSCPTPSSGRACG